MALGVSVISTAPCAGLRVLRYVPRTAPSDTLHWRIHCARSTTAAALWRSVLLCRWLTEHVCTPRLAHRLEKIARGSSILVARSGSVVRNSQSLLREVSD